MTELNAESTLRDDEIPAPKIYEVKMIRQPDGSYLPDQHELTVTQAGLIRWTIESPGRFPVKKFLVFDDEAAARLDFKLPPTRVSETCIELQALYVHMKDFTYGIDCDPSKLTRHRSPNDFVDPIIKNTPPNTP